MASLKTKFAVGLFVLIGFAIIVSALIWLGMSRYLEKGQIYAAYFDESVQGLNRDSAVKYRGVSIGRVEQIGVAPDEKLIEVILKIESGMKLKPNMVAALKTVGITGIVFVEIEHRAPGEPDMSPKIKFPTKYPVIATKPSGLKLFFDSVTEILDQFQEMDIAGLIQKLHYTMDTISDSFKEAQIKEVSNDIRASLHKIEAVLNADRWHQTLGSIESAANKFKGLSESADHAVTDINKAVLSLDNIFSENRQNVQTLLKGLDQTVKDADTFFTKGTDLIQSGETRLAALEPLLALTLTNLETASVSLNNLIEMLSDQPSKLFFGTPPQDRRVEPDYNNAP